jgi:hypothetical protein
MPLGHVVDALTHLKIRTRNNWFRSSVTQGSSSNAYKVLLCKRSEDVAAYRGLFGVIPGGMFQPQVNPLEE